MSHDDRSVCFELTLLPGVDSGEFEKFVTEELFSQFEIMRRTVRGTIHTLLKIDASDSAPRYVWLVFAELFGDTPETAGSGPTRLASASDFDWLDAASTKLAPFATIASFSGVAGTADERT
jgi:hypothetical protein